MNKPCPRCKSQDWSPEDKDEDSRTVWFTCGGCGLMAMRRLTPVFDGSSHDHLWIESFEEHDPKYVDGTPWIPFH